MAQAAAKGRDKLTLRFSPRLEALGAWLEQLIAESTGKKGQGILPVDREPRRDDYAPDRAFAGFLLASDPQRAALAAELDQLAASGHPVARFELGNELQLVQEMVRFQIATAVAGAQLGINPFDQPNVEDSKRYTKAMLEGFEKTKNLPSPEAERLVFEAGGIVALVDPAGSSGLENKGSIEALLRAHVARAKPGEYLAINAFVDMSEDNDRVLQEIREALGRLGPFATTLGYGPRFLHSTGQLHKGDANRGVFVEITQDDPKDLAIPGASYGFSVLQRAQAYGDFSALVAAGRRVLRLHLKDTKSGLASISSALGRRF
jgi:transaldolase/glucose-6-phosphate isomerase